MNNSTTNKTESKLENLDAQAKAMLALFKVMILKPNQFYKLKPFNDSVSWNGFSTFEYMGKPKNMNHFYSAEKSINVFISDSELGKMLQDKLIIEDN